MRTQLVAVSIASMLSVGFTGSSSAEPLFDPDPICADSAIEGPGVLCFQLYYFAPTLTLVPDSDEIPTAFVGAVVVELTTQHTFPMVGIGADDPCSTIVNLPLVASCAVDEDPIPVVPIDPPADGDGTMFCFFSVDQAEAYFYPTKDEHPDGIRIGGPVPFVYSDC